MPFKSDDFLLAPCRLSRLPPPKLAGAQHFPADPHIVGIVVQLTFKLLFLVEPAKFSIVFHFR